jgi:hypothetical protein
MCPKAAAGGEGYITDSGEGRTTPPGVGKYTSTRPTGLASGTFSLNRGNVSIMLPTPARL